MLRSYRVEKFRSFEHFAVEGLARVNLYVGRNNSGKTSLLEAAELLLSPDTVEAITGIPDRRGEDLAREGVDISHLFHGHHAEVGSKIEIAEIEDSNQQVAFEIVPRITAIPNARRRIRRAPDQGSKESKSTLSVQVSYGDGSETIWLPLHVTDDMLAAEEIYVEDRNVPPVQVIGTAADTSTDLWDRIVLTPDEITTTEALRVIEPSIDRVAATSQGFKVLLAGSKRAIPIGSMGDGIRRLLNLSMNLGTAATGTLIVDEIDTGLHYSVMTLMWKLVAEASRRLDIQVFATTHSADCVRSLASLIEQHPEIGPEVALHRVVKGATSTVRYSAEEIQAAAAAEIEVR